jgi:predicted NBD/HSP70 family sugar kinase
MSAVGIDLGGTKIETQIFDNNWAVIARQRQTTPQSYPELVAAMAAQIGWGLEQVGTDAPVGIGAAGLINPVDGLALTANLPATGHPFPADIAEQIGRPVTYVNDCRALALSEAVFGRGKGHRTVMSLILGTGVGGGICFNQRILEGPTLTGGEFGHTSAPAHLVAHYGLPVYPCGCGRKGCIETYISGPNLARLAKHLTGTVATPQEIAAARQSEMAEVWRIWCELTADLLHTLTLTADPDIIVLGGGLSQIDGLIADLEQAAKSAQLSNFGTPPLALAEGGDTSGARGAAYAAWQAHHHG